MIESMRAHGYTLWTALADLIDNSITAESRHIWIDARWDSTSPWISVTDDGQGMSEKTLVNAMRLGSQNPIQQRHATDLGRFGLGLKTASFSQARRLTVLTRRCKKRTDIRRWDLDHLARPDVRGWQLLRSLHQDSEAHADRLDFYDLTHGTQVLLEVLDRLTGAQSQAPSESQQVDHFLEQIERVRVHISMVFHRFLSKSEERLEITLNDRRVAPWDPFLERHSATQVEPESSHPGGLPVTFKGFVLPHADKFGDDTKAHKRAGGPAGWNAQQGFYLYRADRLIIAGDWLQLKWQKEEHFKLARIKLDIPNSMDLDWQIDVKKSTASPPPVLRPWLKGLASKLRDRAVAVYRHRGEYRQKGQVETPPERPWRQVRNGNEYRYQIFRGHPLLAPLIRSLSTTKRQELETLLKLIEETVPVETIWIEKSENAEGATPPFANMPDTQLRKIIEMCHAVMMKDTGKTAGEAWETLLESGTFQTGPAHAIIAQLRTETS